MGGLLRAPKPMAAVVEQPAPVAVAAAPATSAAEQAPGGAREEARARVRRGLAGTIATTDRGVLGMVPALPTAARKTLLGQ